MMTGLSCEEHLQLRRVGNVDGTVLADVTAALLRRVKFLQIRRILLDHGRVGNVQIAVGVAVADGKSAFLLDDAAATVHLTLAVGNHMVDCAAAVNDQNGAEYSAVGIRLLLMENVFVRSEKGG